MIEIKATGETERTIRITQQLPEKAKQGIRHGLYQFGKILRNDIRTEMLKPKSGREYTIRRGRRGRRFRHIAAADGETPANITGKLRKSTDHVTSGYEEMRCGYDNSQDYGKYLELGTRKMNAKPGLRNSVNKLELQGVNLIQDKINEAIERL